MVTFIKGRLVNLDFLPGNFGAVEATNQFLGFARKHRTANNLDPACPWM
jgi:hypothetical protein